MHCGNAKSSTPMVEGSTTAILESLDLRRGLAGKKAAGIDEVQPDISGIKFQKGEFLKKLKGLKGGEKSETLENKKTVAGNMGQSNEVITTGPRPIKSALELNPKILDPKRHTTVTCKENLDPNLKFSSQSEGVLKSGNSLPDSKGRNSRHDRTLSKTIRGSDGHFKVVGNSRVLLPKIMTSIVRLIGSQVVLEAYRTE
ncbi:hypothetical protein Goklo_006007 [Gossypium klotzschianum]|uniref:Uncharacterized protein n=1 Tax=Gossypium klotzschianum TaxID=34286 RepID=A0A7J8VG37_9ROSI|nr:hypothetical protein [Gossypium klotzschianum]